uniref:Uncharacterized protein n=1 Tax=Amphiprion percula TaxID=161767 RepID=A0A3P8RLP1_AMPPE
MFAKQSGKVRFAFPSYVFLIPLKHQAVWLQDGKKIHKRWWGCCATGLAWPGFRGRMSRRTRRTADIKSCAWSPRTPPPHQTRSRMAAASSAHCSHNSCVKSTGRGAAHPASAFKIKHTVRGLKSSKLGISASVKCRLIWLCCLKVTPLIFQDRYTHSVYLPHSWL